MEFDEHIAHELMATTESSHTIESSSFQFYWMQHSYHTKHGTYVKMNTYDSARTGRTSRRTPYLYACWLIIYSLAEISIQPPLLYFLIFCSWILHTYASPCVPRPGLQQLLRPYTLLHFDNNIFWMLSIPLTKIYWHLSLFFHMLFLGQKSFNSLITHLCILIFQQVSILIKLKKVW